MKELTEKLRKVEEIYDEVFPEFKNHFTKVGYVLNVNKDKLIIKCYFLNKFKEAPQLGGITFTLDASYDFIRKNLKKSKKNYE